ncbi:phosphatase PAP2 family protein [Cnuibacter sp. UC19_7]|uniref:phosphatase PAP2 family protein n=1 Tax=Cnuibacter sp. UC19_7 TaxID=3350166 RepID=UPI0036718842
MADEEAGRPPSPGEQHPSVKEDVHALATGKAEDVVPVVVARRWPVVSASVAVLMVLLLGGLLLLRQGTAPFEIDTEWMDEIIEHRSPIWEGPSLVMNSLGGGWIAIILVPVLAITALLVFRRRWAALYLALALAVSAGVVQILKNVVGRTRPPDMLVTSDYGSFPSGHTANAATLTVVFGLVFWRLWVWLAGVAYTILMLLSRTYLGAHWLTDTIGGLLLGAGLAVLIWAPFALRLRRERDGDHRPIWIRARETTGSH